MGLKTVLSRSSADLGTILGGPEGRRMGFRLRKNPLRENQHRYATEGPKTRLGTILGRFGSPKGVILRDLLGLSWGKKR